MYSNKPSSIRLNDEVQCLDWTKPLSEFRLLELDADGGHITVLNHNGKLSMCFDCRYNKSPATAHIKAAKEFLESAKFSFARENLHACLEELFSAYELLLKASLMLMPAKGIMQANKHEKVHKQANLRAKLMPSMRPYVNFYNTLSNARKNFRYNLSPITNSSFDYKGMLEKANDLYNRLLQNISY